MGKQTDFDFGYNEPSNQDFKTTDPPSYHQACMGMMVCPHCGRALICGDTVVDPEREFNSTEEQENMIPRGTQSSGQTGNRPRGKKRLGLRYLSADMLTTTHQLAEISAARTQPDNFGTNKPDVVVVKLRFKGEMILWTLRVNNPALEELGNKFGDDEGEWAGRQVELFIEEDNFDGRQWIRCEAVTTAPQTTKRGK